MPDELELTSGYMAIWAKPLHWTLTAREFACRLAFQLDGRLIHRRLILYSIALDSWPVHSSDHWLLGLAHDHGERLPSLVR